VSSYFFVDKKTGDSDKDKKLKKSNLREIYDNSWNTCAYCLCKTSFISSCCEN